jgi:hypothetical protein
MAAQTPTPGSRPGTVKLPAVRGPESKKRGGTQQSWRSSY